jgi:hypothetical protein
VIIDFYWTYDTQHRSKFEKALDNEFQPEKIRKKIPYQVFPISVFTLHHHAENIGVELNIFAILNADVRHANFNLMGLSLGLYLHSHNVWTHASEFLDLVLSQGEG